MNGHIHTVHGYDSFSYMLMISLALFSSANGIMDNVDILSGCW